MKILVNDIAASKGGALTILKSFYEFAKNDNKNEYVFLLSDKFVEETENIKVITMPQNKRWVKRLKFDLFTGKKYIKNLNIDTIISLQNTIIFGTNIRQIVYIHQSIPFQDEKIFSLIKKQERKLAIIQYFIGHIIKLSAQKANYVIAQTNWMKDAICKKTRIKRDKVVVIKPEINGDIDIKVSDNLKTNTFFYPASKAIYKNYKSIYDSCEILKNKGINDYEVFLTIEENDVKRDNIKYIGHVDRTEVMKKYSESVLIFPSYIESMPLPLLEARKVQTIILASNCMFSKEALKDYENAYFFNPFEPKELALLMEECINGKIKLREKRKVNTEKVETIKKNSWKTMLNLIENKE